MSSTVRKLWICALLGALAFALVPGASPAGLPQLLALGPITVANGTALVSGTVSGSGAGGQVTVNGQPLGLDAAGTFAGVVNVGGASTLDLSLSDSAGHLVDFHVPLSLAGPGGIIPASAVDAVEQAGAALLEPAGGFVGGRPLTVAGSVGDKGQLVALGVNGTDVLRTLGSGQSFSTQLPGTTKEITLSATDAKGVTETTHYQVLSSSGTATPLGTTVAAKNAVGLKIARIQYRTRGVARTKRLRMTVTVKDGRGLLVRGAKVTVRSKAAGRLARRTQAKRSGKLGRAIFILRVKRRMLGRRLVMVTVAQTPTSKAAKTTSVRLARRGH
jgi:hypothetical protein